MNRSDLFAIATAAGWRRGQKPTPAQRTEIVAAVRAQLTKPALEQARVHDTQTSRPMSALEAVQGLMEELG